MIANPNYSVTMHKTKCKFTLIKSILFVFFKSFSQRVLETVVPAKCQTARVFRKYADRDRHLATI